MYKYANLSFLNFPSSQWQMRLLHSTIWNLAQNTSSACSWSGVERAGKGIRDPWDGSQLLLSVSGSKQHLFLHWVGGGRKGKEEGRPGRVVVGEWVGGDVGGRSLLLNGWESDRKVGSLEPKSSFIWAALLVYVPGGGCLQQYGDRGGSRWAFRKSGPSLRTWDLLSSNCSAPEFYQQLPVSILRA